MKNLILILLLASAYSVANAGTVPSSGIVCKDGYYFCMYNGQPSCCP